MIQSDVSPRKVRKAGRVRQPSSRRAAPTLALLNWYDAQRRDLPWRAPPGVRPDPYAVWLSEIMLQQTTVVTVQGYYQKFLARWPTVEVLAAAPLTDVLAEWAGLGYYARARNLHACARHVVATHGGRFPQEESALRQLPGVGPYTAAAVAAIAFDQSCVPIDGNVERVMTRLHAIDIPPRRAKTLLREKAQALAPPTRAGDFAQALMDLGATVCKPRAPGCAGCPLARFCLASRDGAQDRYPVREQKAAKPRRRGAIFILLNRERVFLVQRPSRGLFGGMSAFPATPFTQDIEPQTQMCHAPRQARWREVATLSHVFTHFTLEASVFVGRIAARDAFLCASSGRWVAFNQLVDAGLPTLMRKAASAAGLIGD
jgi:A/G-specific adenine glycosylase